MPTVDSKLTIKLQAEEHDIIDDANFASIEEYVLHLMHQSDYERAQKLVSGKVVLDLGCNCGYGSRLLSQTCHQVIGVDVSSAAIETARRKSQRDNVSFQLIDGITLPFESATFDVVTSFQVVEHIADYATYFSEIRRVLKPLGILLLTTPNAEIRVKPGAKPWNRFHVHEFRGDELEQLLQHYFPFVTVLGQFATEDAYSVEFNRCIRARDQSEISPQRSLKSKIVGCIPLPIANELRKLWGRLNAQKSSPLSEQSKSQFSTDNFSYRGSGLDKSLSLIAFCSSSSAMQDTVSQVYLANG